MALCDWAGKHLESMYVWKPFQIRLLASLVQSQRRFLGSTSSIKRFYKNVSIVKTNANHFEINLDKRKLKTPKGNLFYVENEPLASMVAAEWSSQQEKIELNQMHLTTLSNTVIDNPGNLDEFSIAEKMLTYLESDTLCFRMPEPEELLEFQTKNWNPIVQWFADNFRCSVPVTKSVTIDAISEDTKNTLRKYFNSFNIWSLTGFLFATENLKSLILACALVNRHLSVVDAVKMSRIEENFQAEKWGTVEFHHSLDRANLETRVAAAVVFTLLNCEKSNVSHKSL